MYPAEGIRHTKSCHSAGARVLSTRRPLRGGSHAGTTGLRSSFIRGLVGRAVALLVVASAAARHDVQPVGQTAAGARDHVVERELARAERIPAVLAAVVVAAEDVLAAEVNGTPARNVGAVHTHDSGRTHRDRRRPNDLVVFGDDVDLAEHRQDDRALPRNDLVRRHPREEQESVHGKRTPLDVRARRSLTVSRRIRGRSPSTSHVVQSLRR